MRDYSVKTVQARGQTQHFYTLAPTYSISKFVKSYRTLLAEIQQKQEVVIFERVFGDLQYKEYLAQVKKEFFSQLSQQEYPASYVEGSSTSGSPVAGIIIQTVEDGKNVAYIRDHDTVYGTRYFVGSIERLAIEGVIDPLEATDFSSVVVKEDEMIDRISQTAEFNKRDLTRTWHYIYPIIDNYASFNNERRAYFERSGIFYIQEPQSVPASTCIEGRGGDKGCSTMNLYYIKKTDDVHIQRIFNKNQKEADSKFYQYNPTFSRALQIQQPGLCELQISGTASIDKKGNTQHAGDAYSQIKKTMQLVDSLLKQTGMAFNDICYATFILKRKSDFQFVHKVMQELSYPEFPYISIVGNICRDDLLFELDGVAVREMR